MMRRPQVQGLFQRQTLVIGMGHGMCTCQGAAFGYNSNVEIKVEHELVMAGVRCTATSRLSSPPRYRRWGQA